VLSYRTYRSQRRRYRVGVLVDDALGLGKHKALEVDHEGWRQTLDALLVDGFYRLFGGVVNVV